RSWGGGVVAGNRRLRTGNAQVWVPGRTPLDEQPPAAAAHREPAAAGRHEDRLADAEGNHAAPASGVGRLTCPFQTSSHPPSCIRSNLGGSRLLAGAFTMSTRSPDGRSFCG